MVSFRVSLQKQIVQVGSGIANFKDWGSCCKDSVRLSSILQQTSNNHSSSLNVSINLVCAVCRLGSTFSRWLLLVPNSGSLSERPLWRCCTIVLNRNWPSKRTESLYRQVRIEKWFCVPHDLIIGTLFSVNSFYNVIFVIFEAIIRRNDSFIREAYEVRLSWLPEQNKIII
jgi:hypothetical protein